MVSGDVDGRASLRCRVSAGGAVCHLQHLVLQLTEFTSDLCPVRVTDAKSIETHAYAHCERS